MNVCTAKGHHIVRTRHLCSIRLREQRPRVTESSALDERAQRQNGLPAARPPSHAGAFEPFGDQGLACRLDDAGADGQSPRLGIGVAQAVAIATEVAQHPCDSLVAGILRAQIVQRPSRRQVRDQHRALACGERRPVPLDNADLAIQRRHGPLTASCSIQRARHRHRTRGSKVGLGTATGPAMHLAVDEHERPVHIVAGERLFGDGTLGLGKQRVEFAFEVFELARVRRFVLLQQGGYVLREVLERSSGIAGSRLVGQRMGYFHWGSPPQCFGFAISIVAEDHCPVFLTASPRRVEMSPKTLHSYICIFRKSLEFDHLDVVLDVSSRSSPKPSVSMSLTSDKPEAMQKNQCPPIIGRCPISSANPTTDPRESD